MEINGEKLKSIRKGLVYSMGDNKYEFFGRAVGHTALVIATRLIVDGLYKLVNGKKEEEEE